MNRMVVLILTALVLLALIAYTATFTVKYTETAVVTTFGGATESDVKKDPGLNFKWPYPVQSVTKYDSRQRFLQTVSETQQTADSRQIIVEAFCTWRAEDPLRFFKRFSGAGERADEHYRLADESLRGLLRSSLGAVSQYRMDQLFSSRADGTLLPELERRILEQVVAASPGGQGIADLGVRVLDVGINRIRLPEETSKAVFDAMGANRDRLAKDIEARAEAEAAAIRAQAESDAQRIRAFAERRAQEIRSAGDKEAAQYLQVMNSNPELAVFLKNMEFMREVLARKTTLVLPSSMPGMSFVNPDAMNGLRAGQIPDSKFPTEGLGGAQAPPTPASRGEDDGQASGPGGRPVSSSEGSR